MSINRWKRTESIVARLCWFNELIITGAGSLLAFNPPKKEGKGRLIDKMAARSFRRKRFEAQNGYFCRLKVIFLIDSKKEKKRDHIFLLW